MFNLEQKLSSEITVKIAHGKPCQMLAPTERKRIALQADVRFRVLRILQENPEISQRELARAVGQSVGAVHYVLNALVDKGMVKFGNFTASTDKRRYAYMLTPNGIAEKARLTGSFMQRKIAEYHALKAEIDSLQQEIGIDDQGNAPPFAGPQT